MFEQNTYLEDTKSFHPIDVAKATELLANNDLVVIYIGRESCPFCRKFVKTLSLIVSKIDTPIYYINSDDIFNTELGDFREQYQIVTVPGFMVCKNGEITVRCDSSTPAHELLEMIQ